MSKNTKNKTNVVKPAKTPKPPVPPEEPPRENPLACEHGRAWLREQLEKANYEVKNGPNGQGWKYNETLRPAIEERVEFLRALVSMVSDLEKK